MKSSLVKFSVSFFCALRLPLSSRSKLTKELVSKNRQSKTIESSVIRNLDAQLEFKALFLTCYRVLIVDSAILSFLLFGDAE